MSSTHAALYPSLTPSESGWLPVAGGHELYWEECGAREGRPVIVLHGGPGAGCAPIMRRFFDPMRWRVVLFDQRGCGRSRPHNALGNNTTWDLVADIEALRIARGIDRWTVFGGSWGSTLALAYASRHAQRIQAMVLRGVFLMTQEEIDWFYAGGAGRLMPEAWDVFLNDLAPHERATPVAAYYARLTSDDEDIRAAAARAWTAWEAQAIAVTRVTPAPDSAPVKRTAVARPSASRHSGPAQGVSRAVEALARIECHYCHHQGFLAPGQRLLDAAAGLQDVPGHIVQGRMDLVTPPQAAWRLAQAWPRAQLTIAPGAGHAASEPAIARGLVAATDALAETLTQELG